MTNIIRYTSIVIDAVTGVRIPIVYFQLVITKIQINEYQVLQEQLVKQQNNQTSHEPSVQHAKSVTRAPHAFARNCTLARE